jgi:4-amino-4-deoxy-L-arabinose transferase-like glycosyltransferase
MKYLKIGIQELAALAMILLAAAIRLIFIGQNWPLTNSDEGTIGIMALHIAYHGEHPIFFYGQGYMGAGEAYLAAAFFHLFGPSLFALRLGLVLIFVLFLTSMYILTRLLYSKGLALATLFFLV